MANDRLFVFCAKCGRHEQIGKYYPGSAGHVDHADRFVQFCDKHLDECQLNGISKPDYGDEFVLSFHSEATLPAPKMNLLAFEADGEAKVARLHFHYTGAPPDWTYAFPAHVIHEGLSDEDIQSIAEQLAGIFAERLRAERDKIGKPA